MTELSSLHYRPDGPSPLANRSIASEPILYESYVGTNGVVIIGGGLAAVRTAEQLRRAGSGLAEDLPITVVSNETHAPYDRPPLSKDMLVDPGKGVTDVALKPAEFYAEHAITLRLGAAANSVDATEQTVVLDDGSVLGYDELVIATRPHSPSASLRGDRKASNAAARRGNSSAMRSALCSQRG